MTHPLDGKTGPELREIAKTLNIKVQGNPKPETIARMIMQQPNAFVQKALTPLEGQSRPTFTAHENTEDEVREAIAKQLANEKFSAEFPGDGTWVFKCGGAEESGNLSIPLKVIKGRAEFVAKGKRVLRNMGRDNTYPGQYTDTLIAG